MTMPDFSFSPGRAEDAWYRILLSLLFTWLFFLSGFFFDFMNLLMFSTFFFLFVGILTYIFLDALLFLMLHGDERLMEHRLVIVGVVFGLLFNVTVLYGLFSLFSF